VDERVRKLARGSLRKARVDLRLAVVTASDRATMEPWAACFHAQQAAEKAIKALLTAMQLDFPRTHELMWLLDLIPADPGVPVSLPDAAWLTDFATVGRYTIEDAAVGSDPDWADAERALEIARKVIGSVERYAKAHGWGP
jgi:HEPN domain-containing protein